jgi:hypothetical protein
MLADSTIIDAIKPVNTWTSAEIMTKVGTMENPPTDWKDMSFPEAAASVGG